jgi:hypothetical protein
MRGLRDRRENRERKKRRDKRGRRKRTDIRRGRMTKKDQEKEREREGLHSPWENPASHPLTSSNPLCSLMLLKFNLIH